VVSVSEAFEGGGVSSSAADVWQAAQEGDDLALGAAGIGLAVDAKDFVGDPITECLSAGFGWLIEHVDWLREPLDALAGDPAAITAAAEGWRTTARRLEVEAAALGPAPAWSGPAAERYAAAEDRLRIRLGEAAAECRALGDRIVGAGVAVGTVRALVRDAIADFLAAAVRWLVGTLTTSGLGLPALVTHVVVEGVDLAGRLLVTLEQLLGELATDAREILTRSTSVAELLDRTRESGAAWAWRAADAIPEDLARDAVVEGGKQSTSAP